MTKLYAANAAALRDDAMFMRALRLVSENRREKALRYRSRQDAALSVAAELLLRYSLVRDFGYKWMPEMLHGVHGKPYFDVPVYFSISHSGDYAVCLVSDCGNVGVDIQRMKSADMRTARRVLSGEDCARLEALEGAKRDERFCEMWVLHESSVKAVGGTVFDKKSSDAARLVDAPDGYKLAIAIINNVT